MSVPKLATFCSIIDLLKKQRIQRRLNRLCKSSIWLYQRKEITKLETHQSQTQLYKESRRLVQLLRSSRKNMEVLVNSIFQKRSTTFLKMKIGDTINGQSSTRVRTSLISTMLISKPSLMPSKRKKMKSLLWKLRKLLCMNHPLMKEVSQMICFLPHARRLKERSP